jgi:hypothetical protein
MKHSHDIVFSSPLVFPDALAIGSPSSHLKLHSRNAEEKITSEQTAAQRFSPSR